MPTSPSMSGSDRRILEYCRFGRRSWISPSNPVFSSAYGDLSIREKEAGEALRILENVLGDRRILEKVLGFRRILENWFGPPRRILEKLVWERRIREKDGSRNMREKCEGGDRTTGRTTIPDCFKILFRVSSSSLEDRKIREKLSRFPNPISPSSSNSSKSPFSGKLLFSIGSDKTTWEARHTIKASPRMISRPMKK